MRVWILGAGGQMGGALIDVCHAMRISCVASTHGEMDITDLEKLRRGAEEIGCSHIINCAAFTDVDGAEKRAEEAYAVNALGPENLGILAEEFPIRVVHLSTDYIFDGEKKSPYTETDPTNPLNVYGKSKLEGEHRLLDHHPTASIVRTSWIFGTQGNNFISSVLPLLHRQEHIEAVEDQINRATFNRDLAKALIDLSCHAGIFHFANHEPISRYQIVCDFYEEAKRRGLPIRCKKVSPVSASDFPFSIPRPKSSVLCTRKVEGILGRKPRLWNTVLSEYFDYVMPNV